LKRWFTSLLSDVVALQIPRASGWLRFDDERFIGAVARHGVEVHFWTINDPIVARELRARGASGIVSDRIDLIIAEFTE
jgi:glycerophosphoryl diester phosphodiesterase